MPSSPSSSAAATGWNFEHSFARLPPALFSRELPAEPAAPKVLLLNAALAVTLGLSLNGQRPEALAALLGGKVLPPGAQPIAQAYAGHQYGHFTVLGDGRALLLGEQITPSGERFDIQLKGSGRTAYSRGGDGRAALAPMLREYLISEAMAALGVPTTRSLAVVATGDPVWRDAPLPGAVLVRVAASHLRVGTLEYAGAYAEQNSAPEVLKALADYVIARHYPEAREQPQPYLALLDGIAARQARLLADWQGIGFIHGVMNTDNMALSGETIDYGPCAFMDAYDPATVFSSIDRHGRYAYGNQPRIAGWNLARCAEALLPLLAADEAEAMALAQQALQRYGEGFERAWQARLRAKLGLAQAKADDADLFQTWFDLLKGHRGDFTNSFRRLGQVDALADSGTQDYPGTAELFDAGDFREWFARWRSRLANQAPSLQEALDGMNTVNPAVIARNHQVEAALTAAAEADDMAPLQQLLQVLEQPFVETDSNRRYRAPAPPGPYRTFCGT